MSPQDRKITFPADSILNAVIQDGDIQELQRLLRHQRAELDLNQVNHVGLTALHHAVLANNLDSVKILLNNGANVHAQDIHGFSPLHTAAALGFLQITSLLVIFGADVFSMTKQAELPVDLAKDLRVTRLLTHEMCRKVHQDLYLKSYSRIVSKQAAVAVVCALGFLWRTLLCVVLAAVKHVLPVLQRVCKKCNLPSLSGTAVNHTTNTRSRHSVTVEQLGVDSKSSKED